MSLTKAIKISANPSPNSSFVSEQGISRVQIRWMTVKDLPNVFDIERACFEYCWSMDDFEKCLRQRNCVGLVAEKKGKIVGFVIYEAAKNRINLLNLGIHPAFRGQNIGSRLVEKLIGKLTNAPRRNRIACEIRETNLTAQLFLRSLGFRAVSIIRGLYEETHEDAYLMEYREVIRRPNATQIPSAEYRRRAA